MLTTQQLIEGYFPFDIIPEDVPKVLWLKLSKERLEYVPFFELFIHKQLNVSPDLQYRSELDDLMRALPEMQQEKPDGFIFHVSRCGSTLVSNMLSRINNTFVYGEPCIFDSIAGARTDANEVEIKNAFKAFISLYVSLARRQFDRVIFKFPNYGSLYLPMVRSFYPDVPCLLMIRNPEEVIRSNMKDPAQSWLFQEDIVGVPRHELIYNSPIQNCALVTERIYGIFLEFMQGCRVADYSQLSGKMFEDLMDLFKIESTSHDRRRAMELMKYHSKKEVPTEFLEQQPEVNFKLSAGLESKYSVLKDCALQS